MNISESRASFHFQNLVSLGQPQIGTPLDMYLDGLWILLTVLIFLFTEGGVSRPIWGSYRYETDDFRKKYIERHNEKRGSEKGGSDKSSVTLMMGTDADTDNKWSSVALISRVNRGLVSLWTYLRPKVVTVRMLLFCFVLDCFTGSLIFKVDIVAERQDNVEWVYSYAVGYLLLAIIAFMVFFFASLCKKGREKRMATLWYLVASTVLHVLFMPACSHMVMNTRLPYGNGNVFTERFYLHFWVASWMFSIFFRYGVLLDCVVHAIQASGGEAIRKIVDKAVDARWWLFVRPNKVSPSQ